MLKRVIKRKRELSSQYLQPGFSNTIHAIGIGRLDNSNDFCIQVFVSDAKAELWPGAGARGFRGSYRGVPVVLIEMPMASFLSAATPALQFDDGAISRWYSRSTAGNYWRHQRREYKPDWPEWNHRLFLHSQKQTPAPERNSSAEQFACFCRPAKSKNG